MQRYQIAGPPWFDQPRYDIVAKVPHNTSTQQFQLMLQKLLADRFKLELHRENKLATASDLIIAKGGLKMKASAVQEDQPPSPDSATSPVGGGLMQGDFDGQPNWWGNASP